MQLAVDLTKYLRRFGGAVIVACALLACATALFLWLLINRNAEPGTQVSFLFGAVEYTKRVSPEAVLELQQRHLVNVLAEHDISFWPNEDCGIYEFVDAEGRKNLHVIYGDVNNEINLRGNNVWIEIDGVPPATEPEPYYSVFDDSDVRAAFNQLQLICKRHFADEIPTAIEGVVEPVVVVEDIDAFSSGDIP